jgi:DNA replication protein DnaC
MPRFASWAAFNDYLEEQCCKRQADVLREHDKQARICVAEGVDHVRYLARLTELELIDRERRMVERRIKSAKFPAVKSLGSFDCKAISSLSKMMVLELMEARDEKRLLRLQRQLAKVKLLIIDELGFVPLSKTGAELLFELISQRYECGSTLITSNLPFEEWAETFGSERLTGALLDRLTHHVNILEMNDEATASIKVVHA